MSKRRNKPLRSASRRAAFIIFGLTSLAAAVQLLIPHTSDRDMVLHQIPQQTSPLQVTLGDGDVTADFVSHLPLVVFDVGDGEPGAEGVWDEGKGYYVPAVDDPFVHGSLWVIDNGDGVNHLTDPPAVKKGIQMRLRGNSSLRFPKKQYLVEFLDHDGGKVKVDVLGMGAESSWVLNISWQDPSLMRNHLAYTLGKATVVETPDARYCELIRSKDGGYEYLGVYLMIESIKQGSGRVDIPKYRPNQTLSFILRRDRYDESQITLNTYAAGSGLSDGFLGIKYPGRDKITSADVKKIEERVSAFEKAIYSKDQEAFLTYRAYVDVASFVDYFIFNELFMNYDAGFNSTYLYLDYTARLAMGPFWDFDQCLGNDTEYESNAESTAFHNAPWFRQLLRDPNFVLKLEKRYHQLRAGQLSDERLAHFIRNTTQYLGNAAQRDWNRWQYEEAVPLNPYGVPSRSFDEASASLEETLLTHARWLDQHIDSLYQFSDAAIELMHPEVSAGQWAKRFGDLLAVTFIGVFIISTLLLRREL